MKWLLVVFMATACIRYNVQPVPMSLAELPDQFSAITVCDTSANSPVTYITTKGHEEWSPLYMEDVQIHEMTHARRMLNYKGGCLAFMYRYEHDPLFRLNEEVLAECTGMNALLKGNDKLEKIALLTRMAFETYAKENGISLVQVIKVVHFYCVPP